MRNFDSVKRIVIKVGTSTLTYDSGLLNISRIEKLVRQIANLQNQGFDVVLVSSGAVGAGMGTLKMDTKPKTLPEKQAVASVGQVALIHLYQKLFSEYGKTIGQLLLTKDDFSDRSRFLNARNTMSTLLKNKIIPIINENDAVVVDEIKVGDNDSLSALVSSSIESDLLIILSDIDGLYTANPSEDPNAKLISEVKEIDDKILSMAGGTGSSLGTGGMATKLKAARVATYSGANMIIAQGEKPEILEEIVEGKEIGTLFLKAENTISAKKHWITFNSDKKGKIIIDDGAVKALKDNSSLLPIGILEISGEFDRGDSVKIKNSNGETIAIGVVNYTSNELELIKGSPSNKIEEILGDSEYDEAIHIDNMYILED